MTTADTQSTEPQIPQDIEVAGTGAPQQNDGEETLFDIWAKSALSEIPDGLKKKVKNNGEGISFDQKKNQIVFDLETGERVVIGSFMNPQTGKPLQYIGIAKGQIMTPAAAEFTIELAKAHGWKKIDVHGKLHQKEALWLAAQRNGLGVGNFMPAQNSVVYRTWQEEKRNMPAVPPKEGLAAEFDKNAKAEVNLDAAIERKINEIEQGIFDLAHNDHTGKKEDADLALDKKMMEDFRARQKCLVDIQQDIATLRSRDCEFNATAKEKFKILLDKGDLAAMKTLTGSLVLQTAPGATAKPQLQAPQPATP